MNLSYDENGLIHVVIQDYDTEEVLMLAHMDEEALRKTLETGKTFYWSRKRGEACKKGETSGHEQIVKDILVDCDRDAILLRVKQKVGACHMGYRSCFFRNLEGEVVDEKVFNPEDIYK